MTRPPDGVRWVRRHHLPDDEQVEQHADAGQMLLDGGSRAPRLQQLDIRFSRTFKAGPKAQIKAMVDLYNALNSDTITSYNNTYGTTGASWLAPVAIINPRLMKLGIQVNF